MIQDLQDIWELFIRVTLIYIFGNLSNPLYNPLRRQYFYGFVIYLSMIYSIAFEVCPEGIQFSSDIDSSLFSVIFIIVFGIVLVLYTLTFNCYEMYHNYNDNNNQ